MRGVISRFQVADATGAILKAGSPGRGFRLVPGTPNVNSGQNVSDLLVPGSFPVRVRFRDGKQAGTLDVLNDDSIYFPEEFGDFDILDCDAGDSWCVYIYEDEKAGMMSSGQKTATPARLLAGAAVQNGGSPVGNVGFPLRPGLLAITTYVVSNANNGTLTLWVQKLDGTWFNTGEVYDPVTAPAVQYDSRLVRVPGRRATWVTAVAAMTIDVEARAEAG